MRGNTFTRFKFSFVVVGLLFCGRHVYGPFKFRKVTQDTAGLNQ